VAHLVPGDRDLVALGVLDRLRQARLDVAHRLPQVLPDEGAAAVLEGIHQRQRQRLLDHRRRIARRNPGELVPPLRGVEQGIVLLLVEVEGGDVLARFAGRHPEGDLAAEPARAGDRLVEDLRPVGRAHEEEVVAGRREGRDAELEPAAVGADLARDEEPVEGDVDGPPEELLDEARPVDTVHLDQEGVETELGLAAEHTAHSAHRAAPAHAAAPVAERVELVDEDRAAAPALGLLLGGADHHDDGDHVHAHEHALEGRAGGDDDRHVEAGGDRLGQHRLAGSGRAHHEYATLALAARLDVAAALLDELEDPHHLVHGRLLAPDVAHLHVVVGVARLERLAAHPTEEEKGPEEDHALGDEEDEDVADEAAALDE